MTAAKATEYRIIRQLLHRQGSEVEVLPVSPLAERLIAVLAATAGVFLLGAYLQELLWVLIAAGTIAVLGVPSE
jgi:hypothetical protein